MKTLSYETENGNEVVVSDKILRFSKDWDADITKIHLINGEIINSTDSIKTLEARLNLD
jgi:hypothetical protein